jgi:hypothetical protein
MNFPDELWNIIKLRFFELSLKFIKVNFVKDGTYFKCTAHGDNDNDLTCCGQGYYYDGKNIILGLHYLIFFYTNPKKKVIQYFEPVGFIHAADFYDVSLIIDGNSVGRIF